MKNNEHISHLFEVCDEIFTKQRISIPTMVRNSEGFVTLPNFPAIGWRVEVYSLGDCFETHLHIQGDDVPRWVEITGDTLQELETHLEFIHNWYFEGRKPALANTTTTLTIDDNTPTTILRDLAARALGWKDYPYDPTEHGRLWHCEAQIAPYGPSMPKTQWRPDQNSDQTLALIANLGITVPAVKDEDELKTRVLIEAAKIGARKLGENL